MNLPISIIGRISVIKMTVLPKLIYLFSMIPIQPITSWFKSLHSTITKFYCKNKTPRIKLTTRQKSKTLGGLAAPNFFHYALANQLQYIHKWMHPTPTESIWLDLEQTICKNIHISDLPFCSQSIKQHHAFKSPTIAAVQTAWWKFDHITITPLSPSELTPIWNNPDFTANKKPLYLHTWKDKGLPHLQHIIHDKKLIFILGPQERHRE